VKVTLATKQYVDKTKVTQGKYKTCILTTDNCNFAGGNGAVSIDKSVTTDKAWEEEECFSVGSFYQHTSYSKILINPSRFNVWSNAFETVVCAQT
jgi:hypothetical protein